MAICKTCGRATNVINFKHRCVGCEEWYPIHVGRVRDDLTMVCSAKCEQDADSVGETGAPAKATVANYRYFCVRT